MNVADVLVCLVVLAMLGGIALLVFWLPPHVERKRVERVWFLEDKLGPAMCQWMVDMSEDPGNRRTSSILSRFDEWGMGTICQLIKRKISIGMSKEMVNASLGNPNKIDSREVGTSFERERWVYGTPRKSVAYIWFKDDLVSRIKN